MENLTSNQIQKIYASLEADNRELNPDVSARYELQRAEHEIALMAAQERLAIMRQMGVGVYLDKIGLKLLLESAPTTPVPVISRLPKDVRVGIARLCSAGAWV
jgi:hypothetical protein